MTPKTLSIDIFDETQCELGEGPSWDSRTSEVVWIDIFGGKLHRRRLDGVLRTIDTPVPIGAAICRPADGFLVSLEAGPAFLAEDGTVVPLGSFAGPDDSADPSAPKVRGNDAKCDPAGRAFLGTMEYSESVPAGGLYRLDADSSQPMLVEPGAIVSNGLGWSPDASRLYYADSPTRRVDVFDYDLTTGTPTNRRPFAEIEPGAGYPDGLSVDADGCVWVALWGGSALRRYTPSGHLDRIVEFPCPQVTSCAFVGASLDLLVVTTAWHGLPASRPEAAGKTFALDPQVGGVPVAGFGR